MKHLKKHPFLVFQFVLMVLLVGALTVLAVACEEEESTGPDPACGSGQVSWDEKAQVCRDNSNNRIVSASCCNR